MPDLCFQSNPRLQWHAIDEFLFQRRKEPLCHSVAPAITTPAHAFPSLKRLGWFDKGAAQYRMP